MYYKLLKKQTVVDILDQLIYLKYDDHLGMMLNSDINSANAVLSSDKNHYWHLLGFPKPDIEMDTVEAVEISAQEYEKLKTLNFKTPEEIIDAYTLLLLNGCIL